VVVKGKTRPVAIFEIRATEAPQQKHRRTRGTREQGPAEGNKV
jgi:hypothetical protein